MSQNVLDCDMEIDFKRKFNIDFVIYNLRRINLFELHFFANGFYLQCFPFILDFPYHTIAKIIVDTPSTSFREVWKDFCRQVDLSDDFIARWEILIKDERTEELIIAILKEWSKNQIVTRGQLTQALRDVPLVSTANAIEKYFKNSVASQSWDPDTTQTRSRKSSLVQTAELKIVEPCSSSDPLLQTSYEDCGKTENQKGLRQEGNKNNDSSHRQSEEMNVSSYFNLNRIICFSSSILGCIGLLVMTFLFISKPDTLKCALGSCISNTVEPQHCKDISMNVNVKSQKEYEQAISRFDKIGCIAINITSLSPSDWPEKSQLSHSKFVKLLTVSNVTSINPLFDILSQTTNLKKLEISNSSRFDCTFPQTRSKFKEKIVYSFLSTIKISNFKSCAPVYSLLSNSFNFLQLKTIFIEDGILDDQNINYIRLLMYNAASTLRIIKISGQMRNDQFLFLYSKPLVQVRTIQLDIIQQKVLLVPFDGHEIAGENFCRALINIHTFENTVGIDFLDFIIVLKCTQLQFITAKVIFHAKDPFLNINAAFKGKDLENVTLSLQFDTPCPSCDEINLLGIEDFKKRIKKTQTISFRNCACSNEKDEISSNERDSFVIEHKDNYK